MFGLATRLIGGVVSPFVDQITGASARLLKKLALFVVAGLSLVVVLIALTIAFDLWIASMAGPIIGVLAVAGVYLLVAVVAVALALRKPKPRVAPKQAERQQAEAAATSGLNAQIDSFIAPLLGLLQQFGFRREQLAVLAGTSLAKQLGPIPLVGLAIVAGFLIGRMSGSLRKLFSTDLLANLMSSDLLASVFATKPQSEDTTEA